MECFRLSIASCLAPCLPWQSMMGYIAWFGSINISIHCDALWDTLSVVYRVQWPSFNIWTPPTKCRTPYWVHYIGYKDDFGHRVRDGYVIGVNISSYSSEWFSDYFMEPNSTSYPVSEFIFIQWCQHHVTAHKHRSAQWQERCGFTAALSLNTEQFTPLARHLA